MRKEVMDVDLRVPEKHEGLKMKYFVLNPTKKDAYGQASRMAIYEYARVISKKNKELAEDLINWMRKLP
jgi:hypothetical protein